MTIKNLRDPMAVWFSFALLLLSSLALSACDRQDIATPEPLEPAATVFVNADVVTMAESRSSAEALSVRDGVILDVGSEQDVLASAGSNAIIRDMEGRTILPGFIDAHGHFLAGAPMVLMADLQPPPAGGVTSIPQLIDTLKAWHENNPDAPWIVGFGYDDSLLEEQRHPTKEDLDKVSDEIPVMIIHVSAHLITCNSACLEIAEITAETQNPEGGVIRREVQSGQPTGVLEEKAVALVRSRMPSTDTLQLLNALSRAQNRYASFGITTAQDGAASGQLMDALDGLAASGMMKIDLVVYKLISDLEGIDDQLKTQTDYQGGIRVGGIKLVLDGSPQGKTAWLTKPYFRPPLGQTSDYSGYSIMTDEALSAIVQDAFEHGIQIIAHANGDAAADQLIAAIDSGSEALGVGDRRPVMIHAQTVREDQVIAMQEEAIIPSYFVAHTFYWGDWHRDSVLGEDRARRISPLKSSADNGVVFTIHNDAPVVPPDMIRLLWTAVNRETRSKQTLGPHERITAEQALKAITIDAAYQYFEEDRKGSLEAGKLADMVVLSDNPIKTDPAAIMEIDVIETIKEGETIFLASDQ
ncbi:MAG: amidohydrolase [Henriciella sp.]